MPDAPASTRFRRPVWLVVLTVLLCSVMLTITASAEDLESTAGSVAPRARDVVPLQPGDGLPDLHFEGPDGAIPLSEAANDEVLLLLFYRGSWSPHAVEQLRALAQAGEALRTAGVRIIAASSEGSKEAVAVIAPERAPITFARDPGLKAAIALGIAHETSEAERKRLALFGVDLSAGETEGHMLVPAAFLIGKDGEIAWSRVGPDARHALEADSLLVELARAVAP